VDGETLTALPADAGRLERAEPVVELVPGWHGELRTVRRFEDLPETARSYVERIEGLVGVPISVIGVGPDRSQTLVRERMRELIDVPAPEISKHTP
jgi:adenylosuccinate synthase